MARMPDTNLIYLLIFVFAGVIEEIAKQLIVRTVDKYKMIIQTINESIQFSLIAALGFSFAENIYYFYTISSQLGFRQLLGTFLFRSIFTTCAHLIFSGFFGYYYGIAKFSMNIMEEKRATGKKQLLTMWLADAMDITKFEAYKQLSILKGAMIAIFMHVIFNLLLQFDQIIPAACYIALSFIALRQLFYRKSGRLILVSQKDSGKQSTMARKDEDVVIELLGMWFNGKKFVDVIHICQRLLERDPENKVVQLFKAKALDKLGGNDVYTQILNNIFPSRNVKSLAEMVKEKKSEQINEVPAFQPKPEKHQEEKPPDSDHYELKI
jgi:RsiW-degrading membrane proteinase PrsW (M82 family)